MNDAAIAWLEYNHPNFEFEPVPRYLLQLVDDPWHCQPWFRTVGSYDAWAEENWHQSGDSASWPTPHLSDDLDRQEPRIHNPFTFRGTRRP